MLSFWNLLREGKMNYSYSLYYVERNCFEYVHACSMTAYVCIHMHVEVVGQVSLSGILSLA